MPQGFAPLNPDDFPFDDDSEGQDSASDTFCKQIGLDYDEEPQEKRKFYSDTGSGLRREILGVLRDSSSPMIKPQVTAKLYPKIFHNSVELRCDEYGKWWNVTARRQRDYIEMVGRQIRAITHQINCDLAEMSNPADQLEYLRSVSLAIPIATDSKGRAKYVYHGPDAPQPPEVLEMFRAWAETHKAKNSGLLKLAEGLCKGSNNQSGTMLDPNDIPGQEDQQLDLDLDSL